MRAHRETLISLLNEGIAAKRFNTPLDESLPNTISMTIDGVHADDLVVALDLEGIYLSSGAACASGKPEASHVLTALGLSESEARSTIRISLRAEQGVEQLATAARTISRCVERMRSGSN
jgi:cysteine desulfurase